MSPHFAPWPLRLLAGALALAAATAACGGEHVRTPLPKGDASADAAVVPVDQMKFEVPPPPFSSADIYPCTQCHDKTLPPDPRRRKLEQAHEDIVLHHDEEHRWCLDCHDAENRDMLRLANGTLVKFEESYRLCGQCHGDKYRDWRAGVHGRRTGSWDGPKQYLLCVHCHYSHAPKFKPLAPKPPPMRPGSIR
jgi:hypothetical protein